MNAKTALSQLILDRAISSAVGSSKQTGYVIWRLRAALVRALGLSGTIVSYQLHGRQICIPSHSDLPGVPSRCPTYGRNLERIAAAVSSKYPAAPMIDIGANVGDTAVTLRSAANGPILCVEASPTYAELCRKNLSATKDAIVVNSFIATGDDLNVRLVEGSGTGSAKADHGSSIPTVALGEVALRFGFETAKLVKIDTDGFDGLIIDASRDWLSQAQPVLFWELELIGDRANNGPGVRVFDILSDAGYERFMFYSNVGHYVVSAAAGDKRALEDLASYFGERRDRNRFPPAYADVCAISKQDLDIYEALLGLEREARNSESLVWGRQVD
jgi:FkbM family methyltransferase